MFQFAVPLRTFRRNEAPLAETLTRKRLRLLQIAFERASTLFVASQVRSFVALAEVTVVGGLAVNRAAQIELINDVRGWKLNTLFTARMIFASETVAVPKVSTWTLTGSGWPMA
jgi:reverse gyrase